MPTSRKHRSGGKVVYVPKGRNAQGGNNSVGVSENVSAMLSDIQRAQQAVNEGKRRTLLDAYKLEKRKTEAELFGRTNPYQESAEIQRLSENEAVREFLPELENSPKNSRAIQRRQGEEHNFVFGTALLRSVPDRDGYATYEIPVTHTYRKGYDVVNGKMGRNTKEEKIVKVRVNVLK